MEGAAALPKGPERPLASSLGVLAGSGEVLALALALGAG